MRRYDLLIENVRVLTMDAESTVIDNGVIGVEDGAITLVGEREPGANYQADTRIDGEGMIALPGFVNTHVHIFQSLLKGLGADLPLIGWLNSSVLPFGTHVSHRQQELATQLACLEALRSGCTTLSEFFYTNQDSELADVCIQTMRATGIRSVFMRTFQDYDKDDYFPASYIEPVDRALKDVERLRATYAGNDMLSIWTGPDVTWGTTREGYEQMLEYCLDTGMRYTMHLKETLEDDKMCRRNYGKGAVELLDEVGFLTEQFLAVHCVNLTPKEVALFAERGVSVSHNPAPNLYLGSGVAPIPDCLAAGATVALGTDGAASNNTGDMMDTIRLAALVHKGARRDPTAIRAHDVLRMATCGGARALGMSDVVGSLEVGKRADLVLFDPRRLTSTPTHDIEATIAYSASASNIDTTIVDGRIAYRKGVFSCGIDEAQLARDVQQEMQGVVF